MNETFEKYSSDLVPKETDTSVILESLKQELSDTRIQQTSSQAEMKKQITQLEVKICEIGNEKLATSDAISTVSEDLDTVFEL
jgi:hypothetical protein